MFCEGDGKMDKKKGYCGKQTSVSTLWQENEAAYRDAALFA
jgi:hypothetical protein